MTQESYYSILGKISYFTILFWYIIGGYIIINTVVTYVKLHNTICDLKTEMKETSRLLKKAEFQLYLEEKALKDNRSNLERE